MRLFGTNGIRGVTNELMDCELALRIGRATASVLGPGPIALAKDTRLSSDMLSSSLSAGMMSVGSNVVDLGMVPTPALQLYVRTHPNIVGGVMITASHNPPEFNGIKCISGDGTECSREQESLIENAYESGVDTVGWSGTGHVILASDASDSYVDAVISNVDADTIRSAGLTVCLDCANGASCDTTPEILRRLNVRTITINGSKDGNFPGHPSEPTESNLKQLMDLVRDTGADLGIAHDGDADRCMFVTSSGKFVPGDVSLALLARDCVEKNGGGDVVATVATSSVLDDLVSAVGGKIDRTAVGSPIVARRMIESVAVFGGEDNGGLIFADHQYCRDGAMGAARMLELIARKGSLDDLISDIPEYTNIKSVYPCNDSSKNLIADKIANNHPEEQITRVDGLRIDYDDGWVLLRPSGTEPKFRIYSESKIPEIAEKRAETFRREFEDARTALEGSE